MPFDFDTPLDMRGVHAAKWDYMALRCGVDAFDAIPMWVADMDFAPPEAVGKAIAAEAARGFFGYYGKPDSWREAQRAWLSSRHGWETEPDWILPLPGILFGIFAAMQRYSRPGEHVAMFSPVYHEFAGVVGAAGRKVHFQQMAEEQGRYRMDIAGLARDMPKDTRIVILCSPHNPGGRVWSAEELRELADFCIARDLILVSDEIHYDIVYPGNRHVPTAVAAPDIADRLITLVGATKSFNLAGTKIGAAVVPDPDLRKAIQTVQRGSGTGSPNRFGMVATEAAQRHGAAWLDALIAYLAANRDRFFDELVRAVPGCRPMPLDATYLAWVDFAATGLAHDEVMERISGRARIGVSPGPQFGPGGECRVRFNIATHRQRLDEALARLREAFSDLR